MQTEQYEKRIGLLQKELERAYRSNIIPYFHIGSCSNDNLTPGYVDVYIGIFSKHFAFDEQIKKHIQIKYRDIVRTVSVEIYSH